MDMGKLAHGPFLSRLMLKVQAALSEVFGSVFAKNHFPLDAIHDCGIA
jgi:hypothetical protein